MFTEFTPLSALAGGALIGLAASVMLLSTGRIAGISGIYKGILRPVQGDLLWRIAFMAGLVAAGGVLMFVAPSAIENTQTRSIGVTAIAGLVVGVGVTMGNGCTSGHGVPCCDADVLGHWHGHCHRHSSVLRRFAMKPIISVLVAGVLFGLGLGVSGMTQADKVINFLDLSHAWDPSLAFVMGGAFAVHLVLYRLIIRREYPLFTERFGIPTRTDMDAKLVGGAALFGVGWALGGYCPGPGIVSLSSGATNAVVFVGSFTLGMFGYQAWQAYAQNGDSDTEASDEQVA
jgi:uncharacterized membrane protein YedE/YeeE